MSTLFRAERERDWETSSHGGPRSYTTVKRYKVPDHSLEEDTYESTMRVVHRPRASLDERREVREYVVDRDDARDREVREYRFVEREVERSPSPARSRMQEYRIEREVERSPSPIREYRVERQYERDTTRERETPYGELERYSRSTEYFRPEQPPPQPIIIRNEAPQPVIIQESAPQQIIVRREEPSYEIIERADVTEDRQVARREPRRDEDYYYERKIKEVDRGRGWERDYYDERQYGRDRHQDRDAYSDDDVVYIHKEKEGWGRDRSPNHKRHLAEGVIAGVGAAQLMRHHRKKQGEEPGHHVRQAVGYGALGAVGAEVISRVRNRSRSSSFDRERDPRGRRHHRSRSSSRVKKLGTLAAVAGIGALAYAAGRKNNPKTTVAEDRRSRSRRRKSSVSRSRATSGSRGRSSSRPASETAVNPEHRSRRAAQVGLASAAVAGLVERHRSKSRNRKGERSHSRIRQGIPIAAAGAAGAAITGLYEKQRAKKEKKDSSHRSKSRSKSRPKSVHSSRRGSTVSDTGLVEYGGDPIYSDAGVSRRSRDYDDPADYRNRRRSSSSSSGARRPRHRSRSSRSRSKSRTRAAAETAAVAGVAGLAAHEAAKRRDRKKAEKERQRREEDSAYSTGSYSPPPTTVDSRDPRYFPETNYFPPPPNQPVEAQYAPEQQYTPETQYPPYNPADYPPQNITMHPPTGHSPPLSAPEPGNPYAHQDPRYRRPDDNVSANQFAPAPASTPLLDMRARGGSRHWSTHAYDDLNVSLANGARTADRLRTSEPVRNGYVPHYQSYSPVPVPVNNHASSRSPVNVPNQQHVPPSPSLIENEFNPPSLDEPDPVAPPSVKSVQFDLNPQELSPERQSSPTHKRERDEERREDFDHDDPRRSRHRERDHDRDGKDRHRDGRNRRDGSVDSISSNETVELPPRFDEHGRRKDDDPIAMPIVPYAHNGAGQVPLRGFLPPPYSPSSTSPAILPLYPLAAVSSSASPDEHLNVAPDASPEPIPPVVDIIIEHPSYEPPSEPVSPPSLATTSDLSNLSDTQMKGRKPAIALAGTFFSLFTFSQLYQHVLYDKLNTGSEREDDSHFLGSSRSWLDRRVCNWLGLCGLAHLNRSNWKDFKSEQVLPVSDEPKAKISLDGFRLDAQTLPVDWAGMKLDDREIPQYVVDHAPLIHLYSGEEFWPGDMKDHLYHTTPHLNYTPLQAVDDHPTLNNLRELNRWGRSVYLTSDDNPEEKPPPDWLGGEVNIPDVPKDLKPEDPDEGGRSGGHFEEDKEGEDSSWFHSGKGDTKEKGGIRPTGSASSFIPVVTQTPEGEELVEKPNDWDPNLIRETMRKRGRKVVGGRSDAPAVLIVVPKENGVVDAFWFFFYSFNKGNSVFNIVFGNHVGDWEHTTVRFQDGVPKAIFFSEHSFGEAYTWDAVEKAGKRPIGFSATGTHAMYATSGVHPYVLPGGILHDVTDRGPLWDPAMNMLSYTYDYQRDNLQSSALNSDAPRSWFYFNGHWGDKFYPLSDPRQYRILGQYHYVNGPLGPRFKNLGRQQICQGNGECVLKKWIGDKGFGRSRLKRYPDIGEGEEMSEDDVRRFVGPEDVPA